MDMPLSFGKAQPGSKDLSQNSKGERRRARNASPPGGALVSNWALKSQSVFNRAMIMPQANDSALLAPRSPVGGLFIWAKAARCIRQMHLDAG